MFRGPFLTLTLDPHDFQPIKAGSDAFDHDRTINVPHDMATRLKLPFSAAMNRKDEAARLSAHDPLNRVKRA
ncbi:hypothetical protein TomTYG75_01340 [Sphingobium sp. TomTYG75]